jgi:hypothetical protein
MDFKPPGVRGGVWLFDIPNWQMGMPDWFTKSKQTRAKSRKSEPQPFEVLCDCGQLVSGIRRRRHQTVACSSCGAVVFVLPEDVYPPISFTRKPGKKKRRQQESPRLTAQAKRFVQQDQIAVEPIFDDDDDDSAVEEKAISPPTAFSTAKPQKKFITSFRIVMLSTVVVVSLTIWWGLRARALDQAAHVVQSERKAANVALKQGDLAKAAEHYRQACQALETLGRDDASSRQTCQLAKETNAAANLTAQPLLMIIEDAHQTLSAARSKDDRAKAESHALDLYADQWIIMETNLTSVGGAGGSMRWVLDYPFAIGTTAVEIDANLPVFEAFRSQNTSQRVLFAAQLAGCRLRKQLRTTLVVELNPETAFLWTNADTLKTMGFVSGDEDAVAKTMALLARQSRMVGVTP